MSILGIVGPAVIITVAADTHDHAAHAAADTREPVSMPPEMRAHLLGNMRGHLMALGDIQAALADRQFERAADIAENKLGMSSLEAHKASHMAPYMPKPMQEYGTTMHRAASRFALTAQEAVVDKDLPRALKALADLTQKCSACHASYRVN